MRVFATILLAVCSAFAYQVTSPGDSQGWTTSGPNVLQWQRVSTDPLNFTVFLTNVNDGGNSQLLDAFIDGTLGSTVCSAPSGGWVAGSGFRVNIAQDAQLPNSLLAQSNEFNITAGSSSASITSGSVQTATSGTATSTSSASGVSSSNTSTTPTGTSAASLNVVAQAGIVGAVAALTALATTLF